jgi:hypothetical protein
MLAKHFSAALVPALLISLSLSSNVHAQNKGSVLGSMESWCKQQTAVLGNKKMDPAAVAALVKEEFNVKEMLSLQDALFSL